MIDTKAKWRWSFLNEQEASFTAKAANELREAPWAQKMLNEHKIKKALLYIQNPWKITKDNEIDEIKSACFEVMIAHKLLQARLPFEYEYRTGMGKKSVDIKTDIEGCTLLIELTSLKESEAVKENTVCDVSDAIYFSSPLLKERGDNSPEVRDTIKAQKIICDKSLKFPAIRENFYHIILVNMENFNAGCVDYGDYLTVAAGSESTLKYGPQLYQMWTNKDGSKVPLSGIFDPKHPDSNSKNVVDRIHVLGFVLEKQKNEGKLRGVINYLLNPKYLDQEEKIKQLLRFVGLLNDKN